MTTINYQEKFEQEIKRLNPQQKEAVETLEGPVLVFAGPGTGKTQVLTLRIANLIAKGLAEPQNILALTFTKAAAVNMQKRLTGLIGSAAYRVSINTFHGFCQEIIENEGEFFPFKHDSQVLDDVSRNELMEKILLTLPLEVLRPAGDNFFYLRDILQQIGKLKQENIKAEQYEELVKRAEENTDNLIAEEEAKKRPSKTKLDKWKKTLAKQKELLLIYKTYEKELTAENFYDYADMILATIVALKENPGLLASYQEQFQYVLVDEYQDTNNAQNEILRLLMQYWEGAANIFVVGDAQQSIYRFQGANLENFLRFEKDYPTTKKITLKTGYRCSNKIYALAHHLMVANGCELLGTEQLLNNFKNEEGESVTLTEYQSRDSEILEIAQKIVSLHEAGAPWDEIAVIYRNNKEAARLMEVLAHFDIPIEIEGGVDALQQELIKNLLIIVKLIVNLDDQEKADFYFGQMLWQPWWQLKADAIIQEAQKAREKRESLWRAWSEKAQSDDEEAKKIISLIEKWKKQAQTDKAGELLRKIITESGLMAWVKNQDEKFAYLIYLYTIEKFASFWEKQSAEDFYLEQFWQKIKLMQNHGLTLTVLDLDVRKGAISLTTAHKAKGREWTNVFVCGVNNNNWNKKEKVNLPLPAGILQEQREDENVEAEARRLLFVALTRAKKRLFISWHESENESVSAKPKLPSMFIACMQEEEAGKWAQTKEPQLVGEKTGEALEKLITKATKPNYEEKARAFLKEKAEKLILSPSILDLYLTDTDKFLQQYLLQMPKEPTTPAIEFGNSIHLALENLYRGRENGQEFLPLETVQEIFRQDWLSKNMTKIDEENYLKIGLTSLENYWHTYTEEDRSNVTLAVEKKFGYQRKLSTKAGVPVCGKIDRLDRLASEDNKLRVIDYKSGRSQTENQLLGKTSSASLSEREKMLPESLRNKTKRQLLFYKLLCQLEPNFPYEVTYGMIDFVKKTESNTPVRRKFDLPEGEVQELEELLYTVREEIVNLQFLDEMMIK